MAGASRDSVTPTLPHRGEYLKGSKTNGGRLERYFEKKRVGEPELPVAPYSSFVSTKKRPFLKKK